MYVHIGLEPFWSRQNYGKFAQIFVNHSLLHIKAHGCMYCVFWQNLSDDPLRWKKKYFRSSQQTGYENGFNDERKRISLGQKCHTCHSHTKVYAARLSVRAADDHCRHKNMKSCKVRSFLKQCFTLSHSVSIFNRHKLVTSSADS